MIGTTDNRQFFERDVFDYWASRRGLTEFEEQLLTRFLARDGSTLEAGTGAGRILHELAKRGFHDLHGFDYVPGFIDVARSRDASGAIDFSVQDAVDLDYQDAAFDQALYIQQVLCFIEDAESRMRAMHEARRACCALAGRRFSASSVTRSGPAVHSMAPTTVTSRCCGGSATATSAGSPSPG